MDTNVTIVTAYYVINSKFPASKYGEWIQKFMKIKSNKVIFTDNKSKNYISKYELKNTNTTYIITDIKDFLVSKYDNLWDKHLRMDHEKNHNINLYKIWAEKTNFMLKAMNINPYNTTNFVWCDIGCFRNDMRINNFLHWPKSKKINDKVILLQLYNFLPKELVNVNKIDERFRKVVRIGGGIIAGNLDTIPKWHNAYYQTLQKFFENNIFAGKDQNVYAFTILQNPSLVHIVRPPANCNHIWVYLQDYLN